MSAEETKDPFNEAEMATDTQDFVARMQKMAAGELPPTNATVGYLLDQYKDTQAEFEKAQRALAAAQESIIKSRGRLEGLERDLKHWDAKAESENEESQKGS